MDSTEAIYNGIKNAGINFIVSVPCVNLKKLLDLIEIDDEIIHVPVTREEEGLGIAAGAYMAGKKTAILMQNSGIGNSVNALTSLFELFEFPIVMIISHRGSDGEPMIGQVPMGKSTTNLLEAININYNSIEDFGTAYNEISNSWEKSLKIKRPIAFLFEINYW
ncbi:MAG: sulfopyruvate decarboxylase subunit alpha [Methanobrevibacter sp.]|jgi:sulfopyruvate decarboxylase subunit alpha|nr:sulfopyruvate decarboxylase subunit alpha [Candidatus Methanoflexus mossambicus]